jgi:hypothetical protein
MPKIFIGHGASPLWQELRRFLSERLHLPCDEFDATAGAGKTISERLDEMLEEACFAFLVMTAEDEHADGTRHARENVIHEVGLFQGRLGRQRAIVLLEQGCQEFSNIHGLIQIRFPSGDLLARSENIREVLEREAILNAETGVGLSEDAAASGPNDHSETLMHFEEAYWKVHDGKIVAGPFCSRCRDAEGKGIRMRESFVSGVADMRSVKYGGHYWTCPECKDYVGRNPHLNLKPGAPVPRQG